MKKVSKFISSATEAIFYSIKESFNKIETPVEKELIANYIFQMKRLTGEFIELYFNRFPKDLIEDMPVFIKVIHFESFLEDFIDHLDNFYEDVESVPELALVVGEMLKLTSLTLSRYKVI